MRIRTVEAIGLAYAVPAGRRYGMARGIGMRRETTLIKVTTEDGVVGWGEAWGPPRVTMACLELIREAIEGMDLFGLPHLMGRFMAGQYHLGIQNQIVTCLSGLDMALVDAQGRTLGLTAAQLLGGQARDRVPVYASGGYMTPDPVAGYPAQLERLAAAGCPAAKIKIGLGPVSDEARVRQAQEALGPGTRLLVDANGNYTVDLALASMERIAPYGIGWYEEPLTPLDVEGYARLRPRAPIPIATGEALYTAFDMKRLLDVGGVDVLQPDLSLCGGFYQGRLIAQLAALHHVRVSPHVWGSGVGLAAACHFVAALPDYPHGPNVPAPCMVEYDVGENALRDELLKTPLRLEDGYLRVPEGPGLGVEPDPAAIERFRI